MIYTVIADIKKLDLDNFSEYKENRESEKRISAPHLNKEVEDHINKVKNERLRKERFAAYHILSAVTKMLFEKNPCIEWLSNGKPRYKDDQIFFSISHCGEAVAVSISDSDPVGVDIEGVIDDERAARLESRFFSELSFCERELDVNYIYCKVSEKGVFEFSEIAVNEKGEGNLENSVSITEVSYSDSFTARWTLYEASLKCDGGGFTSLPCLGMMLLETRADIKKINLDSKIFYVSTAASR